MQTIRIGGLILAVAACAFSLMNMNGFESRLRSSGRDDFAAVAVGKNDSVVIPNRSERVKSQTFEAGFAAGKKNKVDFGIELHPASAQQPPLTVTLTQKDSNFGEFDHSVFLELQVVEGSNMLHRSTIEKNIGINSDPNFIRLEIYDEGIYISTGKESLTDRVTLPFSGYYDKAKLTAGVDGQFIRMISAYVPDGIFEPSGYADIDEISSALLNENRNGPCGIWSLLDYEVEISQSQIGGNYQLAVLPADGGSSFQIIYISGAKTLSDRWLPGTIKGTLTPTRFAGSFDLQWIDSEGNLLSEGCNARMEGSDILSLDFPLQKSRIRFSKIR